jgi:hypothetical protein
MSVTNKTQRALLALMRSRPEGVGRAEAARFVGVDPDVAYWHLRKLRCAGMCGPSAAGGGNVVWALSEHLPAIKARIQEQLDARQRREYALKRKRRLAEQAKKEADEFLCEKRSTSPAGKCEPMRPRGPISVFHLAA